MITLYRIAGSCLLLGSAASLVSLAAFLDPNFWEIGLILMILTSIILGISGTVIYYQREELGNHFPLYIALLFSTALIIIVGSSIQWVS